jgi:membrane protein YdbS with pleckstrin-like domain
MSSDRPQSALNLRLALNLFGLVFVALLIFLAVYFHNRALAVFGVILLVITIVDLVIILVRRHRRHKREPGTKHSIFE